MATEIEGGPQWPIGTRVLLTEDDGRITETVTRSRSWDLCGSWVVKVKGRAGGYLQSRMQPVEDTNE